MKRLYWDIGRGLKLLQPQMPNLQRLSPQLKTGYKTEFYLIFFVELTAQPFAVPRALSE